VRAAAELGAEGAMAIVALLRDFDHAHVLAVLVAEEGDDALVERVLVPRLALAHGHVVAQLGVHQALRLADLVRRHRLEVVEVEPQAVGRDERARLPDVVAEDATERGLEEMRRGVVAHNVGPADGVDLDANAVTLRQPSLDDAGAVYGERLARVHRVMHLGAAVRAGDRARIPDLTAALGVERRLDEHELDVVAGFGRLDDGALGDDAGERRVRR
jgi:hypothetical protein